MTVSVMQPNRDSSDNSALIGALGIARDLFKVGMDEKQSQRANQLGLDKLKNAKEAQDRKDSGERTQGDLDNFVMTGGEIAPLGTTKPPPGFGRIGQMQGQPVFGKKTNPYQEAMLGFKGQEVVTDRNAKIAKYQSDFQNNNKEINDLKDKVNAATFINQLIDQKDPILDAVAQRQVFRLSGDVGVIKDNDLRDLGSSPAVKDRAIASLNMLVNGQRLTDEARDSIRQMAGIVDQTTRKQANIIADRIASTMSGEFRDLNKEDALKLLNPESILPPKVERQTQQKTPYTPGSIINITDPQSGQMIRATVNADGKSATPLGQ